MSHLFKEKTYTHLTYCDACKQLLWGVRKQGFQCRGCGYNCHRKCQAAAGKCSRAVAQGFLEDADHKSDSRAESYLRQLSQKSTANDRRSSTASSTTTTSPKHTSDGSTSVYQSAFKHVKAIATSDKLQNILAEAATTQQMPVNAYLAKQAPLNPQITARNFTRFVSRCGPVFAFRDELLLLLSWENRVDTLVSLIIYCIVCLHPKMIFLAPQTILFYFILSSYPKRRASSHVNSKDKTKQTKVDKQPSVDKFHKRPQYDTPTLFPFNLSTLFQPASDESPEYLRNLQNIQNTMGEFSDMYDLIMSQINQLNWSSEEKTMRILQLIIVSSILVSLALFIIPIKLIFFSFGLLVYGLNTRFAKYIINEIKPYMVQFGKRKSMDLVEWYVDLEKRLEIQDQLQEISVFENQRWWPRRGYLHEMVEDERSPWSDFTGSVYMPIITEIPAPKGYQWKETSEWTLDTVGPWIDTYLEIEIAVKPDEDGWIYSDDNWRITIPQIEPVDFDDGEQNNETQWNSII
ncbi:integral peroxisomal membrane peroxin-domain-containing protein [Parasitella parasitica]|nr:integral peroxisomal membrane peroxin-domain-containing protein [Parasitella parasitica]